MISTTAQKETPGARGSAAGGNLFIQKPDFRNKGPQYLAALAGLCNQSEAHHDRTPCRHA